jgi:hypothetical protein
MTRKLQLMSAAAVLFAMGAGTQLAIAQSGPKGSPAQKGAAQGAAARKTVSQPVGVAAFHGNLNTVATALTKDECKGLGGVVGDSAAGASCTTGKACYTAGTDGVVRSMCITE